MGMFRAALSCVYRVLTMGSGALGLVISLTGTILQSVDKSIVFPGWIILALGALLLFITAIRIEWELMQEKEKNRKPRPDMKLEDVVKRIRGKEDIFGPENAESTQVLDALSRIRESGANGAVTIFGVKGLQYLPNSSSVIADAIVVRLVIPAVFWEKNAISYLGFVKDRIGVTEDTTTTNQGFGTGYGYLWFDSMQVDSIWPPARVRIAWKNPFSLVTAR
jgi:hypothetical protein